ncbi:MAG: hypothetical protein P8Y78_03435 [Acidihalobacter sp.]
MGFELYERQLPDAVRRERETMLADAVAHLRDQGYEHFAADGLRGYDTPDERRVPGGNVPLRVDVLAQAEGKPTLHALAETSSVISDPLWGRRWQAFARLAEMPGDNRCLILVHPEDVALARARAAEWKLSESLIQGLERRG